MGNAVGRNERNPFETYSRPQAPSAFQNYTPPYQTQTAQPQNPFNTNNQFGPQPYVQQLQQPYNQQGQQQQYNPPPYNQQPYNQQPYNQIQQQPYQQPAYPESLPRGYLPGNQSPYGNSNMSPVYGPQQIYPQYYQQQPTTGCPMWTWCIACLASLWCCQAQSCMSPNVTDPITNTPNPTEPSQNPTDPKPASPNPAGQTSEQPDNTPATDRTNDEVDDNNNDYDDDTGSYDS